MSEVIDPDRVVIHWHKDDIALREAVANQELPTFPQVFAINFDVVSATGESIERRGLLVDDKYWGLDPMEGLVHTPSEFVEVYPNLALLPLPIVEGIYKIYFRTLIASVTRDSAVDAKETFKLAISKFMDNFHLWVTKRMGRLKFQGVSEDEIATTKVHSPENLEAFKDLDINPTGAMPSTLISAQTWAEFFGEIDSALEECQLSNEAAAEEASPVKANVYLFPAFVRLVEKGYKTRPDLTV